MSGYRDLAAAVVTQALADLPRERAADWLQTDTGQFWLSWLTLRPDALVERLRRRAA